MIANVDFGTFIGLLHSHCSLSLPTLLADLNSSPSRILPTPFYLYVDKHAVFLTILAQGQSLQHLSAHCRYKNRGLAECFGVHDLDLIFSLTSLSVYSGHPCDFPYLSSPTPFKNPCNSHCYSIPCNTSSPFASAHHISYKYCESSM